MAIGNRIYCRRELPEKELVEAYRSIPVSNISDAMNRIYAMGTRIRLYSNPKGKQMCGVALTVNARSGDNLMIHQAVDMAEPGDVIVVANGEESNRALAGEVLLSHAAFRGVEGFVFDGAIRDADALATMELPVYATGITPTGPFKDGPGEINVPVSCGGIAVMPGDIVVGDADGVLVIPKEDAKELLPAAMKLSENDSAKVLASKAGRANRAWVMQTLEKKNCALIDTCCPRVRREK